MQKEAGAGAGQHPSPVPGKWLGPSRLCFGWCNSAMHTDSACGAVENRSCWRAEAEQVSLLCIVLSVILVTCYVSVVFSDVRVLFKTLCLSFAGSKKVAHVCWQ